MWESFKHWLYASFIKYFNISLPEEAVTRSELSLLFTTIIDQINTLPYEVSHANRYHPMLYREINSRFSDFEQIQKNIELLNEELTKKLLDPLNDYTFGQFISLSNTTETPKTLAHFQGVYSIQDSLSLIKKCTKKTMVLYTQLENHPDVDEYYISYIDRRTILFFKAVLHYIECLETP